MNELTVEQKLRAALEQLVGASEPEELRGMARALTAVGSNDPDVLAALAAIQVLLDNPERDPDEFHMAEAG